MAKFLFTGWPYPGCINPQMAVALGLKERGHTVAFYNGTRMRDVVLRQGFEFFPFGKTLDEQIEILLPSAEGIGRGWEHRWQLLPMFREFFVDTIPAQIEDLNAVLDTWSPDVIVCERPMWGPYLVLQETRKIPVTILEYATCLLPGPDVAYPGLGLPPPRTWYARLRANVEAQVVDWFVRDLRRSANKLRERYGLPPLRSTLLALSSELPLTIVPSCPEFDYQRTDLPPSVKYVGSCLWYQPALEPATWLNELPQDRPIVHVTEGTLYSQEPRVLRAAAQGLANLPMTVIMTTGTHRDIDLGPLAPNIIVKRWVPHSELLPRTAAMVMHGGGGTTMAALTAGIPTVVVPLMWDQPDNAVRVAEAGAGIHLPVRQCTPERLRTAVERVLNDASYRENAQRIAASLRRYRGPAQAAELLEEIVIQNRGERETRHDSNKQFAH